MPEIFLVEKKLKKVYVKDQGKYAYVLRGSPHIQDVNGGVLEGV